MTNIRVLVLTTTFPRWEGDATPAFVYELSKRLQEDGFDIVVLAPHHEGAKRFEIVDGMKVYRFPYFYPTKYQRLVYEGGILPNLKRSNLAKVQAPLLVLSELFYAFKIIRKEKIDVVHSHWIIPSGFVGAILNTILRKRHVLTVHAAGLFALEKLPLKRGIANFIAERCDRITVVSSYIHERLSNLIRHEMLDAIGGEIEIVSMGVDTVAFRPDADKNRLKIKYNINSENILLFVGRLADKKGLPYLIKAMPKIISKSPDTKLIICGDGPLRNESEELVKELDLYKNIVFEGYISDETKIDYLQLADILIAPSIVTQSGDTEGLPVVILEGLASGTPVVASDVGGVSDAISDGRNGFLIRPENSSEIADKVIELLSDCELRRRFSDEGLKTIEERFAWKIISNRFAEYFRHCN